MRLAENRREFEHVLASVRVTMAEERAYVKASYVDLSGAYASQ
jgi:hypothetical protein